MKKINSLNFKQFLIFLLLLSVSWSACKKDGFTSLESDNIELSDLKALYNAEKSKLLGTKEHLPGLTPKWDKTVVSEDNGNFIYEVELDNPNHIFTTEKKIDVAKAAEYSKLSLFKLVFIRDKNRKIINSGYMNIIANKELNKTDIEKVHYKKVSGFTGKIQFYTISGQLKNGWYYVEGKIEKMYSKLASAKLIMDKFSSTNGLSAPKEALMKDPVPSDGDCGIAPVFGTICFQVGGFYEACETQVIGWDTFPCPTNPSDGGIGGDGGGMDSGDGGGGGGGGGNGDSSNSDVTHELKEYPCAKSLLEQITQLDSKISGLIKDAFTTNSDVNVAFKADPSLIGTFTDGQTRGTGTNHYIGINPDVLTKSTQEYILAVLYHEAMHAYLNQKYYELGEAEFKRQFKGIEMNGGRAEGVIVSEGHVPLGYNDFVNGIKDAILAFNPSFNPDRAMALARDGIFVSNTNESLINSQERDATKVGATGTKCP